MELGRELVKTHALGSGFNTLGDEESVTVLAGYERYGVTELKTSSSAM